MRVNKNDIVEVDNLLTQLDEFIKIANLPDLYSKPATLYLSNSDIKDKSDEFGKIFGVSGMKLLKMIDDDMSEATTALKDIYEYLSNVKNGIILLDTMTIRQDAVLRYTPFLLKYVENMNNIFTAYVEYLTTDEMNKDALKTYKNIYDNGVEVVKNEGSIAYTVKAVLRLPEKPLVSGDEGIGSSILKAILTATNFLIGKPIFFFMKWYADYEYTKYLKAKERAEYLNLKIEELTRKFDKGEGLSVKESKIIEYYEDMLNVTRKQLADYEDEIRQDIEDDK